MSDSRTDREALVNHLRQRAAYFDQFGQKEDARLLREAADEVEAEAASAPRSHQ